MDPNKSSKCFANLHRLNDVAHSKEGYFWNLHSEQIYVDSWNISLGLIIARDIGLRSWPIFSSQNWQKFTKVDKNSQKLTYLYTHFSQGRKWLQTESRSLWKFTLERKFSHVLCFITVQLLHIENQPNIFPTLKSLKFSWFLENITSTLTANFSAQKNVSEPF